MPVDFDAYSIEDKETILDKADANLEDDTKIWRISSLTAFVDEDTKINLFPVPESKRAKKIIDTKYNLSTINDLN